MISTFFLFYWINVVLAQRFLKSSKCCTKMMESETLESVWYSLISVTKIIKYKPYSYTAVCNYQVLPGLFWSHAWLMWRIQSGIQLTSSTFYNALIHEKKNPRISRESFQLGKICERQCLRLFCGMWHHFLKGKANI